LNKRELYPFYNYIARSRAANQQDVLIKRVNRMMVKNRGFTRFREFNTFLMDLYDSKKKKETIADLYHDIIAWFAINND